MNRKQLEQCAWEKTPPDERRSEKERYDWKKKKSSTTRLRGNAREVLVFNPSGTTEGTINDFWPLWSLYSDELEQRCKEDRVPKLRAPYSRTRADYTGDIESSPGSERTAAGRSGPSYHSTKKSPTQLQREIDEALRSSDRASHGYDTERLSDREFEQAARFESKKYGLKHEEALRFVKHPRFLSIRRDVESWREQHGFPATNSALTRGYLLAKLKDETARLWGYRR